MFIVTRKYTATTGVLDHRFDFQCDHCGVQTGALVQVAGMGTSTAVYGVGGNAENARWQDTFVRLWVVDTSGGGSFEILIDDKHQGIVGPRPDRDLAYARFNVRRGRSHEIAIVAPTGTSRTFHLDDATDGKKGWVLAPDARAKDLCIFDEEVVYGRAGSGLRPDSTLLRPEVDDAVLPVIHSFDHEFEKPPSTVSTKQSEVRKRVLRGFVCSTLGPASAEPYGGIARTAPAAKTASPIATAPVRRNDVRKAEPPPLPTPKERCEEGVEACSDDGKEVFACKGGRMRVSYRSCLGPKGCRMADGTLTCDQSLARLGESCPQSGMKACGEDRKTLLECASGTFKATRQCKDGCSSGSCN